MPSIIAKLIGRLINENIEFIYKEGYDSWTLSSTCDNGKTWEISSSVYDISYALTYYEDYFYSTHVFRDEQEAIDSMVAYIERVKSRNV